jgi:lipopolysaccharide/colanic/teichoic acid biosynthesis glycosyltransferase
MREAGAAAGVVVYAGTRYETAKRLLDIGVALGALLVLAPLLTVVALAIWLTDRGPVIFSQARVGKDGREFKFYKFRSMVLNAEELKAQFLRENQHGDNRTFKMRRDPRITRIGRVIRRFSIDELPQLYNVLRGDMSLVGPRPAVPNEVKLYTPADRRRLAVTPGLTCIWQVSGRSELPFSKQVELDIEYIAKRSFTFDLVLLARTVPAVLSAKGAY